MISTLILSVDGTAPAPASSLELAGLWVAAAGGALVTLCDYISIGDGTENTLKLPHSGASTSTRSCRE